MSKKPPMLCPDFMFKQCDTDQNMFFNICYQTKNRGPYVSLFSFVSSLWRNCHKIEGHHSIENTEFKYPYFFEIITENTVALCN